MSRMPVSASLTQEAIHLLHRFFEGLHCVHATFPRNFKQKIRREARVLHWRFNRLVQRWNRIRSENGRLHALRSASESRNSRDQGSELARNPNRLNHVVHLNRPKPRCRRVERHWNAKPISGHSLTRLHDETVEHARVIEGRSLVLEPRQKLERDGASMYSVSSSLFSSFKLRDAMRNVDGDPDADQRSDCLYPGREAAVEDHHGALQAICEPPSQDANCPSDGQERKCEEDRPLRPTQESPASGGFHGRTVAFHSRPGGVM